MPRLIDHPSLVSFLSRLSLDQNALLHSQYTYILPSPVSAHRLYVILNTNSFYELQEVL